MSVPGQTEKSGRSTGWSAFLLTPDMHCTKQTDALGQKPKLPLYIHVVYLQSGGVADWAALTKERP
jgi:hypothetical protein